MRKATVDNKTEEAVSKKNKKQCEVLFIRDGEVFFKWDNDHTLKFRTTKTISSLVTVTYNGELGKANFKILDIA